MRGPPKPETRRPATANGRPDRKNIIGRKTIKKRMRAKLLAIKIKLRRILHDPIAKTGAWVKQMLKGI